MGVTHTNKWLHQMMFVDQDYERVDRGRLRSAKDKFRPLVTVHNYLEKYYSVVNILCKDRTNLLFDTVCTLIDMDYVVFHGTINATEPKAYQVCIKHLFF